MSQLTKFNLTTVAKSLGDDPVTVRRAKLMAAVDEQGRVLAAVKSGTEYQVTAKRAAKNENGEREVKTHAKTVRPWFFAKDNGWYVHCRYGNRILNLHGKSNAIFVEKLEQVGDVLLAMRAATKDGEFDKAIAMTMRSAAKVS